MAAERSVTAKGQVTLKREGQPTLSLEDMQDAIEAGARGK